jgi:hypothetical protein
MVKNIKYFNVEKYDPIFSISSFPARKWVEFGAKQRRFSAVFCGLFLQTEKDGKTL